jgi:hypothetical protein
MTGMIGLFETIAIGFLVLSGLTFYSIARGDAKKFLVEITLALGIALGLKLLNASDLFAYLGAGITLSLFYFMKK